MSLPLRPLGRSGIRVPSLCLGTMTFGLQCDEKTSFAILDAAWERGVSFLDTADVYPLGGDHFTAGRTEEIVGRWMKERGNRDEVVLATKCAGVMGPGPNDKGLSRYHIQRAVEASLERLQTDVIDLYQSHAFDPFTPHEETLRAFDDLVRDGKVRYLGTSNHPAWRLADAVATSERLGLARYECLQPRYNLLYREIETEVLPYCIAHGLGVIVYNPIAGGALTGKYTAGEAPREGTRFTLGRAGDMYQGRYWQDVQLELVTELATRAEEGGTHITTLAVAWVLAQKGITSAIIGASRPEQLEATVAGAAYEIPSDLMEACEQVWWRLPRRPVVPGYR